MGVDRRKGPVDRREHANYADDALAPYRRFTGRPGGCTQYLAATSHDDDPDY